MSTSPTPTHPRLVRLCVVAALALLAAHAPAQFVAPEGSDFRNSSTLPLIDRGAAESLVIRLQRALSNQRPDDAAFVMRALRARPEPLLMPLGPRTHVPALEKAARLVMQQGDDAVREAVLRDARAEIDDARRFRDIPRLLEHAARGVSLPTAGEAALAAARLLFEQGRWWDAAAMAARAGDLPGASRLAEAARARLPSREPTPPAPGPWRWVGTFPHPLDDRADEQGTALILDGREHEVLMVDPWGVRGLDLVRSETHVEQTFEWLPWPMGPDAWVSVPAPRHWTASLADERLVLPFNVIVDRPLGWRSPRAVREARLLALDLGEPPLLVWTARNPTPSPAPGPLAEPTANGDDPQAGPAAPRRPLRPQEIASSAYGPVTISGDRVFTQCFRVGLDTEVSLAAHDLATGAKLFETPLVRGTFVPRFASRNATLDIEQLDKRAREAEVCVVDGVVYACTGFGVVAAVDGVTGALLHTFRYDRLYPLEPGVYAPAYLFDTGGWEHEPVRAFGDRIVVAPSDSRFLYMLARTPGPQGQLILDDPIERLDRRSIVALQPDPEGRPSPAVLCTRRRDNRVGLVLLGPDGHTLSSSPLLPRGEEQTGRPAVVGRHVLVPFNDGVRIFRADDLAWGPAALPVRAVVPPIRAVQPFADGVLALAPEETGEVHVLLWRQMP